MAGGKKRLHAWIEGRVQGVWFRDSTRRRALELGLCGWVRNLPDGRVEAVFSGDGEACERALEFVRRGPSGARVRRVDHVWETTGAESVEGFDIR